jgi:ribonuclease HI
MVGIKWIYCPGHAGVCGNEETDRLAVLLVILAQLFEYCEFL